MTRVIARIPTRIDNQTMSGKNPANRVLFLNTLAFAICFAAWTLYGVLITYLVDHRVLVLDKAQIGWLIGAPVLTGSILRLPIGILADKFGGKPIFIGVMVISAVAMFLTSFANGFAGFLFGGLAFGLAGASFAVGVAYTSLWFPKNKQGTALGLFGMGNMGTAFTALGAPPLLNKFTENGANLDGWRVLPQIYAGGLLLMAVVFALLAVPKRYEGPAKTLGTMLAPLRHVRVWRFGLYYFVLFGGFVALSQWLIPYYLNVYGMTLAGAGLMATMFSLPSGLTRAVGGFLSDRIGARTTLYLVLSGVTVLFLLLVAPRMEVTSPGEGIMADKAGTVTQVTNDSIVAGGVTYPLKQQPAADSTLNTRTLVMPRFSSWQEPAVKVGDEVKKKQIVARGVTHVFFQANQYVFTGLLLLAGVLMGLGMAAVYKHIPEYFPNDVGVVGGLVGVLGGLGGFILPIVFGYLLKGTGLWTTCWLLLALLAIVSLVWMHLAILKGAHKDMVAKNAADETASPSGLEHQIPTLR
jgi:MFS transporter, NNP family, nitrate/nitrite transporter